MKKLAFFLVGLLFVSQIMAAVSPPLDRQSHQVTSVDWSGADTCNIDNVSATNPIICSSGAMIVYGVITSSIT